MNQGRQTIDQMLGRQQPQQQYMGAFSENEEKSVTYLINNLIYRVARLEKKCKKNRKRIKELREECGPKKTKSRRRK